MSQTLDELKSAARTAQHLFSKGLCSKAQAQAAQSAYDVARSQPQREAAAAASRARHDAQTAVWQSVAKADRKALHAEAVSLYCVRETTVKGGAFRFYDIPVTRLVPPTSHWGNWADRDAILHHGVESIDDLLERFAALSSEPFNGTYAHLWSFAE